MTVAHASARASPGRLRPLLALTRAGTAVAGAALCVAGGLLDDGAHLGRVVAATASVACLIAFAQVVNDIVDVDIDRHQKPRRPIVAGAISPRAATTIAAALLGAGLTSAALAGPGHLAVATAIAALAWCYSVRLKNTVLVGNATVALLASAPVTFGAAAGGGVTALAVALQAQIFLFMSAFEIVKTGIDADGDRVAGLRTIATRHGVRAAAAVGVALALTFALVAVAPVTFADDAAWYSLVIGAGAVAPTLLAARSLARSGPKPDDLRPAFGLLRLAWFAGVAAPFLL